MSKRRDRKKNSSPNIPQSTLDRARINAGLEPEGDAEEALKEGVVDEVVEKPKDQAPRRAGVANMNPLTPVKKKKRANLEDMSAQERARLSPEFVAELLHNPTKIVPESQLREEYSFVLRDLTSMGLLAAVLIVVLVALAQFV